MKKMLYIGCAVVALQLNTQVWAQGATEAGDAGTVSGPEEDKDSVLETVYVTVERRESNIQDVPAAVSAFTEDNLKNAVVSDLEGLTRLTPGLNFTRSTFASQPTIRGIGTRGVGPGDESTVAVYVNGVYQVDQSALNLNTSNIERIEVLKGPQGTLFGRNATAGALNIIYKKPTFAPEGNISLSYGSFNTVDASGRYSGPITDNLAFQVMGNVRQEDGYYTNIASNTEYGGMDSVNLRGGVLYTPTDALTIEFSGAYTNTVDMSGLLRSAYQGNALALASAPAAIVATNPWEVSASFNQHIKNSNSQYSLTAEYEFENYSLKYIVGHSDSTTKQRVDNDLSNFTLSHNQPDLSAEANIHELQLTSDLGGRLEWIGGLSYFESDSSLLLLVPTSTGYSVTATRPKAEAYSGYVEGTFEIFDNLYATAGVRYTDETRDFTTSRGTLPPNLSGPVNVTLSGQASAGFDNTSKHFVLKYDLGSTNVYASYNEGFKSGLFNGFGVSANPNPVRPELISSYEVGLKSDVTNSLRVNLAAFTYDYTDLQVQATTLASLIELINAADAEVQGLEAEVLFQPVRQLTFRGGLSLLDTEYTRFPGASALRPNIGTPAPGNRAVIEDASGKSLIRAPEWTFNLGADWVSEVADGELRLSGNVFSSDGVYWDVLNLYETPSTTLVTASASWTSPSGKVKYTLSGDNLTEEDTPRYALVSANGWGANYYRPRFVSFGVSYTF